MDGDFCLSFLNALAELDETWGFARLGLALSAAYFLQTPQSASELAQHLAFSDDTVRRLLKPLVNVGRVAVLKQGRSITYMAEALWAKRTVERIQAIYPVVS